MSFTLSSHRATPPPVQKFSLRSPLPVKQSSVWKIEAGAVRTLTWLEDGTTITTGIWGTG